MTFRRPIEWLSLFLVFTGIGIFFGLHYYLGDVAAHVNGTLPQHLFEEMTGAYGAMLLVPFMGMLAARFPFARGRVWTALAANVGGLIAYTLAHTTLIYAMRVALGPPIGMHYRLTLIRYPSEAAGDVVYYALLMTAIYLLIHFVKTRELQTRLTQLELENLRLQLQPHFLFNTLNAISAVMYEDVAKADEMLAKLSDFLRDVLAMSGAGEVPIEEELAIERKYVEIMTARLERRLELRVDVDESARGAGVPFMILQPLLENSIRHGMTSDRDRLAIAIGVHRRNGTTIVRVDDDGAGLHGDVGHGGHGLRLVRSRLAMMYGDGGRFSIAAGACGGTQAVLTLPFAEGHAGS
jgi:two-component system LytT family sensor kinase